MSPRIPMKVRHVRVSDKDWNAAQQAADERGENLSEEIREFIKAYGQRDVPLEEHVAALLRSELPGAPVYVGPPADTEQIRKFIVQYGKKAGKK